MKLTKGKLIVTGIVVVVLVPILLFVEFKYGVYQKYSFQQRADRYLAETYDEPMKIVKTRYLWDNIEPILAIAHPVSDPSLQFSVHVNESRASGISDDYATTLWRKQATREGESLLSAVEPEYARHAFIDFSCCEVSQYDYAAIRGDVPHYGTTGLPLDLFVSPERPMQERDLELMYQTVAALRESDTLSLKLLAFRFEIPGSGAAVSYEIPGAALKTIASSKDLEVYNATRRPAKEIAKLIGAALEWNESQNEALFTRGDTTLIVRSWGNEAILNGEAIQDSLGAYLGDSMELMVPVWLIERAFGVKMELF